MEDVRSTWTDSRLDDLATKVDTGFARVDGELREIRGELSGINRTIAQLGIAVGGGFAALVSAMIGLIATQL
jgi:hypothetical protein